MPSRVELFEKIRRDRRLDDLSIRELADRHGVHRRTVRQALAANNYLAATGQTKGALVQVNITATTDLRTAKALGISIPQSILTRADEIIR